MKVGLTYDLRAEYLAEGYSEEETAEFDRPDTIEALEDALRALGHETVRIGKQPDVDAVVQAVGPGIDGRGIAAENDGLERVLTPERRRAEREQDRY